ncbi:heterogeneous nuclear ribonucleoprotein C-like [Heterodontus francisci]|uniref:heterogeneous nuclear ribonucleoprotein C-like n=1 Tax=Heterodontus francisci TaxID=7792 RepID=UPI00355AD6F4
MAAKLMASNVTNKNDPRSLNSRVFIGNLNTAVVKKTDVEGLFAKYGKIVGCSVHKGYAFVQYANERTARTAVAAEDGRIIAGQPLGAIAVAMQEISTQQGPTNCNVLIFIAPGSGPLDELEHFFDVYTINLMSTSDLDYDYYRSDFYEREVCGCEFGIMQMPVFFCVSPTQCSPSRQSEGYEIPSLTRMYPYPSRVPPPLPRPVTIAKRPRVTVPLPRRGKGSFNTKSGQKSAASGKPVKANDLATIKKELTLIKSKVDSLLDSLEKIEKEQSNQTETKSEKTDEGSSSKAGSESKKAESEGTGEEGDTLEDDEEELRDIKGCKDEEEGEDDGGDDTNGQDDH